VTDYEQRKRKGETGGKEGFICVLVRRGEKRLPPLPTVPPPLRELRKGGGKKGKGLIFFLHPINLKKGETKGEKREDSDTITKPPLFDPFLHHFAFLPPKRKGKKKKRRGA